jgi:hypothetical protein
MSKEPHPALNCLAQASATNASSLASIMLNRYIHLHQNYQLPSQLVNCSGSQSSYRLIGGRQSRRGTNPSGNVRQSSNKITTHSCRCPATCWGLTSKARTIVRLIRMASLGEHGRLGDVSFNERSSATLPENFLIVASGPWLFEDSDFPLDK